jgi:hypothetical protein
MSSLVREEPLVEADSPPARAGPLTIARRSGVRARTVGYVAANITVWVVWVVTGAGYPWPVWVNVASGLGLLMNAWAGLEIRRELKSRR